MINLNTVHLRQPTVWVSLTLSLVLSACGTFGPKDGAPENPISAADIEDATPKHEPLSQYGNPSSYVVAGKRYYVLDSARGYVKRGTASWYGTKFHGRRTSSGEIYDMYAMSAAHKSLPLPTYVKVTNLENQKSAIVKVNDRGPFHDDRLIDLSYAAAVKLGIAGNGTAPVEVKAIELEANTAQPTPATSVAVGHFVQVGAFTDRGNAERLQQRISLHIPFPVSISNADNTYYRVRVGPFSDRQQVEAAESRLSDLGINNTLILND
ncbi:septal ring lytic transglycosylase RlpA family protein [Kaarinaea lacus]